MKKNLSTLICCYFYFIFISGPAYAQYFIPDKQVCNELKSKIVVVELSDENETDTMSNNEILKRSFKDYWTITPVEFHSSADFQKILASGDTKYAALIARQGENIHTIERTRNGITISSGSFYFDHFDISLSLITGPGNYKPVCTIAFANKNLMSSDLLFAVQQISRLVNASLNDIKGVAYYDHKKNIEFVKTKTLLIPKELFKEKELPKLAEKYTFPFKIVSLDEMNDMILAKNEEYIYPKIIWSMQHNAYGWITISAKDGSITSFMTFGGVHVNPNQSANEIIKIGDLKYIASGMAQGMNNRYK